jgi:hypothetical protein
MGIVAIIVAIILPLCCIAFMCLCGCTMPAAGGA